MTVGCVDVEIGGCLCWLTVDKVFVAIITRLTFWPTLYVRCDSDSDIHLYSSETVANNEKENKYTKNSLFTIYQFRHHTQWSLRMKLSFRCANCSLDILKLNI